MGSSLRIGIGYDVHAFAPGRRLVIGGVEIEHPQGLLGHSDADVLCHAVCDALLGAARLGDIGAHFPDTDPAYEGIDSLELLRRTGALVVSEGFEIVDIDCCVIAQVPRLTPYRDQMRAQISAALSLSFDAVGVKATTTEHLGFEGREEGIGAQAVVLLSRCSGGIAGIIGGVIC
jgi:2-C-methyl-D-erythritol 2,4-cyclodiphosphate synthase